MRPRKLLSLTMAVALALGGLVATSTISSPPASAEITQRTLFERDTFGYECYRSPAIVRTKGGALLAIAAAKTPNAAGDCPDTNEADLVMRRSTDNGDTWQPPVSQPPKLLAQGSYGASTDPVTWSHTTPIVDLEAAGDRVVLLSKMAPVGSTEGDVHVQTSDDGGVTWTSPRNISADVDPLDWGLGPGPSHGIQLEHGPHAGRLVSTAWSGSPNRGALLYSDDSGETWARGATYALTDNVLAGEMSVFERTGEGQEGSLYVLARNQAVNPDEPDAKKSFAVSSDSGMTFDAPFQPVAGLIAPGVQGATLRLRSTLDGDKYNRVLFSSPSGTGTDSGEARTKMMIRSSYTEGRTWQGVGDGTLVNAGGSHYSDMAEMSDGRVALFYEAGADGCVYCELRLARFTEADLGFPDEYTGGVVTPDLSGLGTVGRIRGGTQHSGGGRFDEGVQLDGVDDHVQVPFAESLAVDDSDFTAMAWIKYSSTTGNRRIMSLYADGDHSQAYLRAEPGSGRIRGYVQSGSNTASVLSSGAHNDNRWHHVAFQRAGTTLRLYVDGVLSGTQAGAPGTTISPGRPFQIDLGQKLDGTENFAGGLDEARLYERALTATEIARIHGSNATDVTGAILRLPFHPNFPTTADVSPSANTSFVHGGGGFVPGVAGNALTFDGVDDRVHVPFSTATNLGSAPFTVTTWFRHSGGTDPQTLLWFYGVGETSSQLWVRADPANDTVMARARTPQGIATVQSPTDYGDGAWHFLALRRTSTEMILSVDGTEVARTAAPVGSLTDGYGDGINGVNLGQKLSTADPDPLAGALDEVQIYHRALTDAELEGLRADSTVPADGVALRLPLNSRTASQN